MDVKTSLLTISFLVIIINPVESSPLRRSTRQQDAGVSPGPRLKGNSILENIDAYVGEEFALLPCEVENRGENPLHWLKDDQLINYDENSATGNIFKLGNQRYQVTKIGLKVKNVKEEAEGAYKCRISLPNNASLVKFVNLKVYAKPDHLNSDVGPLQWDGTDEEDRHAVTVSAGRPATFKCLVKGEGKITTRWFEDGIEYRRESQQLRSIRFRNSTVNVHARMILKETSEQDDGKVIKCVVTQVMTNGTITNLTRTFDLTVNEASGLPPTIFNENTELEAMLGQNFTYECKLVKPELLDRVVHIGWAKYVGNGTLNEKDFGLFTPGKFLKINDVQWEDAGKYLCAVTNQMKQDFKIFNLTVVDPKATPGGHSQAQNNQDNTVTLLIGSFAGVILVVVSISVVVCLIRHKKPAKQPKKRIILLSPTETYHDNNVLKDSSSDLVEPLMPPLVRIQGGRNRLSSEISSYSNYEFPLDEQWEISPRNRVQMQHLLGEGAFGCVYYAELQPEAANDNSVPTPIAVKMLKADATDKELVDLVQELEVMKRFSKHRNIINLVGCMTRDGPLYVIVEYAKYGNLRDFLRARRPVSTYGSRMLGIRQSDDIQLTSRDLVSFAHQVACGMQYLASNQCLHRDLAARNVLVTETYEMKIADFGLSRNIAQSDYYKKVTEGKLPIKWMAPEALIDRKYTTKSDVWAYGVLLWEIFSLGASPYPTVPHERLFEALREGHRMDKPPHSSQDMYVIMRQCWQYHAAQRATFPEIVEELERILSGIVIDEYLDLDVSPFTSPRASTTSPCTSTTSCSGEDNIPPELPPPPPLPTIQPTYV